MIRAAIVLAAFGSRHKNAMASLAHIMERVQAAYPDLPVRVAYTSKTIRGHMKRAGEAVDSVPTALDRLLDEGVTHVAVQSLHLIPGTEFHELLGLANELMLREDGFRRVEVGFPLVAGEAGIEEVADAVLSIAEQGKGENDAVLFMGHGTKHDGNVYYEALHRAFQERDPSVHLGAMEAEPGIDDILERFKRDGVRKAHLLPFLFGAGWHAARDMVGDGENSWKTRLERAGIECEAVLRGAGEYDILVDIWLGHLHDAMKRMSRC
ncbi:sirohydrochlorin cobaltochelatase [Pseudodesulfovibrio thermohalotolerans]|uniref:sirohydrochlorin cobaltochelatase n=1 Tax=Pseudodesulfovibrio thermohalotolerans TaxID=2880651 RepID=UPI0024436A6E|nr:sirohydrochlorin cobaltochelatase [Pseudodesulfovibrio thermohalotolerans]WFS63634.1 sirohydrochlorin cobaltochelatase [Pseudodesulfovibrio thermohalotolerans]